MTVSLWPSQVEDLGRLLSRPRSMHLSDPGTGKTPTMCIYMYARWKETGRPVVWAQPVGLLYKNKEELLRFTPFQDHEVSIGYDFDNPDVKVWLMSMTRFQMEHKRIVGREVGTIVADEAHKGLSTHGSKTSEALYYAMRNDRVLHYVPMSGSLVNGRLDSVYPHLHVVEPRFYPSHASFMYQHAIMDDYDKPLYWRGEERLGRILAGVGVRRSFKEVHGEVEKVFQVEKLELDPKHRKVYDRFHREGLLEMDGFDITGWEAGPAYIRARQVLEHPSHLYDPEDRSVTDSALPAGHLTAKDEALMLHFEDHVRKGTPVVVFSPLVPHQNRVLELMRKAGLRNPALINGEVTGLARNKVDVGFRKGTHQALVVSPEAAGFGYNWQFSGDQEVQHCIFAAISTLDTDIFQPYGRFIRGARSTPLRITFLKYVDSIDTRVYAKARRNSQMANKVDVTRPAFEFL